MATDFVNLAVQKVKQVASSLGKKIVQATPFADPTSNNGRNFWSGYGGEILANQQKSLQVLNQLPRVTLPKPQVKNQIAQTGINLVYGIPESVVNIPRNFAVGASRTGTELGTALRDKRSLNYQNLAAGIAPLAESIFDVGTMGLTNVGKNLIKTGGEQVLKEGFLKSVGKGALKGVGYGAAGGATYGLDLQYGKKFDAGEVLQTILGGAVVGGAFGGGLAALGSVKSLITRTPEVELQLRDKLGRWTKGETPVKPKGMPKPQWDFQLKFNEKYKRNPYAIVTYQDVDNAIKFEANKRIGLQARDVNLDKNPLNTQATKGGVPEGGVAKNPINQYLESKIPELKNSNADIVVTNRGDTIEIDDLFFNKKGTGLGTKIVNELQNYADQQGKFLQVNKAYNKSFWSKFGFDEIADNTLRRDPKVPQPEGGVGVKAKLQEKPQIKQTELPPSSQMKAQPVKAPLRTKPTSLEQEAIPKQSKVAGAKPLTDIITQDTKVDVKAKVGFLDYLRTPDRVLKKIGLENEALTIRKAYDSYLNQLPKEIDKVTEWSKRVAPESNVRIFQYLDGQDVKLNPNEAKVAGEIRTYLDDWAKKLKLPEDKKISHYITHIFEKDFIQKEFDEDIAKLIQNRVAGSVYDPFLEKRLGKMGYVEDTWRALDAYVKRATRKLNMDPALEQTKNAAKNLELSQYNYVKQYIDRINLRPTEIDNLVDNSIKQIIGYKFGQRPTTVLTRAGRQAVYRGTLGLNPGTALKNLSQGANTYSKLGERYTIKGYWDILTKGAKELEDVGILKNNFIEDRTLSAGKQTLQKIDRGLFAFFDGAEKINRGAAYYGAKAKALANGLDEQAAIEAGKKMVRDTQFTFGSVDTPVAMQSDIVKLLTQFQSYTLKQTEFLGEMIASKDLAGLLRYGLASTAFVLTLGKLIGMELKDIVPSFRIGLPPTLQTPIEIGKAAFNVPDKYGNVPTTEEKLKSVGKSLIPFLPAGTQIKKTVGGLTDVNRGYSESQGGRVRYPVSQTPANYVRGGLFGANNLPEAQQYYDTKRAPLSENQTELFKQSTDKQSTYKKIIDARAGDKLETQAKKEIEGSQSGTKYVNGKIIYWDDTEQKTKTIKIDSVTSMPETSSYEKLLKQNEAYKLTDDILKLKIEEQAAVFASLGISPDDATYYQVANAGSNDLKRAYLNDNISNLNLKDRGNLLKYLVSQRKEINGKMVLANGIVDDLYNENVITKAEQTMLKNLKIVDGKPVTKLKGRGKKTALKKISYTPSKLKIKAPNMKTLLAKTVKLKAKKYKFRRTL